MNFIGVFTLARKELKRAFRVPGQTLGQPVVTTLLYFLAFGFAIGNRIGEVQGIAYMEFIMPGLIMMNVMSNAFFGIASGLMLKKITKVFSDILVSTMSYADIVLGYVISSVARSFLIALLIFITALFFVPFAVEHPVFLIFFTALVAATFSLLGVMIGIWGDTFEQISIFPTFLITPLAFLGGIFYSIDMLPPFAQTISQWNPFFYMINGMRYGFYGVTDVSPWVAVVVAFALFALFALSAWWMFRTGYKIKS